jgi:hypothetical protein
VIGSNTSVEVGKFDAPFPYMPAVLLVPPTTNTRPLVSFVAVSTVRGFDILAVATTVADVRRGREIRKNAARIAQIALPRPMMGLRKMAFEFAHSIS